MSHLEWNSLTERSLQCELIDGSNFEFSDYAKTLSEISQLSKTFSAHRSLIESVEKLWQVSKSKSMAEGIPDLGTRERPLRILDIGFGFGDGLREVYKWSQTRAVHVQLAGVELNAWAVSVAKENTPESWTIQFLHQDVFQIKDELSYHIIFNSLMTHHLAESEIVKLLKWMTEHSELGWFINDLHRHPVAYWFIKFYTRVGGFHRLIQNDAPLSVARAFKREDWERFFCEAGIERKKVRLAWRWAFRWTVLFSHLQPDKSWSSR